MKQFSAQNGIFCIILTPAAREMTLKTKYNLMCSDSPPPMRAGPLLQSSELHRNDDTNSSSGESDTDILASVSQRGSPAPCAVQWSGQTLGALASLSQANCADQQRAETSTNTADPGLQCIKPRELTGQLLHPMTIRHTAGEIRRNESDRSRSDSENGTLKPSRHPQCSVNNSGKDSENLPKSETAELLRRAVVS